MMLKMLVMFLSASESHHNLASSIWVSQKQTVWLHAYPDLLINSHWICGGICPPIPRQSGWGKIQEVPSPTSSSNRVSHEFRLGLNSFKQTALQNAEMRWHSLCVQPDLSPAVLWEDSFGEMFELQATKYLVKPTAGDTWGRQIHVLSCHQEASVLPTVNLEVSNSAHLRHEEQVGNRS